MDATMSSRRPSMPFAVRWSIEICTLVSILSLIVVASDTWNAIQFGFSIMGLACAMTVWLLVTRHRYGRWMAITLMAVFLLTTLVKSFDGFVGTPPLEQGGFDAVVVNSFIRALLIAVFGVPIYRLSIGTYADAYFTPKIPSNSTTVSELTTLKNASVEPNA